MEIKNKEKKEGGRQEKEEKVKLHIHDVFYEHLTHSLIQSPVCITNFSEHNGR